jgi:TonB family protein
LPDLAIDFMAMSLKPYAYHSLRRIAIASATLAIALTAFVSGPVSGARRNDDVDNADPLARARRNVVAVVDWDRADGKAVLGSGILLQRDKALIPCRLVATARNIGVSQGQRRSEAKPIDQRAVGGLCELKIVHPVHFDPLPLEIRPIEEVKVGDAVYAISTGSGRELSMTKARISGIAGSGENKVIRISRRLGATASGSALFDHTGALIGMNTIGSTQSEETAFNYPMEYYLQGEEIKSQQAKFTTPPWEDTKPPAQLRVNAEPSQPPPKAARTQRTAEPAAADNLAYKQAVKEYLEDVVRASTRHVVYPDSARKAHWTGTTSIWFRLNSGGELGESFVDTSSGYATLDVAALLAVRKAISDLRAPPLVRDRGMMATVAVTFALGER